MPLLNCKIFDIFDEIDAMMTPKKSYIFSIGKQIDLPSSIVRLELIRFCLEMFLVKLLQWALEEKIATSDETIEDAIKEVQKGRYPVGLRLIF